MGTTTQENGEFEIVEGATSTASTATVGRRIPWWQRRRGARIGEEVQEDRAETEGGRRALSLEFQHSVQDDEASDMPILPPKDEGEDDTKAIQPDGPGGGPHSHAVHVAERLVL